MPCCLAKVFEALMPGLSQHLRALRLPPVHLGAALQFKLLIFFGNLTFPEVQGCSGFSCSERKQGSLHRILSDFIVNVLNYSPNALNATSLAFSSRHSFV